jgi:hypothetical protein
MRLKLLEGSDAGRLIPAPLACRELVLGGPGGPRWCLIRSFANEPLASGIDSSRASAFLALDLGGLRV